MWDLLTLVSRRTLVIRIQFLVYGQTTGLSTQVRIFFENRYFLKIRRHMLHVAYLRIHLKTLNYKNTIVYIHHRACVMLRAHDVWDHCTRKPVFVHLNVNEKPAFSKISPLGPRVLKTRPFWCPKKPFTSRRKAITTKKMSVLKNIQIHVDGAL